MIYSDFETILVLYQTCDNKDVITKDLNKHEVCGYSINVLSNRTKSVQQSYYRGKDAIVQFCKEIREISKKLLDTEMKMKNLTNEKIIYKTTNFI